MDITPEGGPIGAAITGLDLTTVVSDTQFKAVQDAVNERAVVIIRDQVDLPPSDFIAFARRFGKPQINVRAEANNEENPEIFWVSNVHENGKPLGSHDAGRYWHSDLCYLEQPSDITLLNALEVPAKDGVIYGSTEFISAAAAYDGLTEKIKKRVADSKARNGYRYMWNRKAHEFGKRPVMSEEELRQFPEDAVHPIFRTHPRTGRKCLYVCDGYTHAVDGIDEDQSRDLLQFLFRHLLNPAFRYRHEWLVGDLLIWDNCAVQHKANFDYPPDLRRLMQRCTIEGSVPF